MIAPKDILVTGGQGRLGKVLGTLGCRALSRQQMDITVPASIQHALEKYKPALIINCAAYTQVDRAERERDLAFAINRDGAENLASACAAPRIPLIHVSTDCVFGDGKTDHPVTEADRPMPLSVYGWSKLAGEAAIRADGRRRTCIARISWLFDEAEDTFIGKMLNIAKTRSSLQIVDDAYGRPTPAGDLAKQILTLAEHILDGLPLPEILHLGPQTPVSRFDWATEIFAKSAELGGPAPALTRCPSATFPEPARRPRGLILDVATATALLGLLPDWRIANAQAISKLLKHPHKK